LRLLPLQRIQKQRDTLIIILQEVFDLGIGFFECFMVGGEPHNSVEESLILEGDVD